MQELTSRQLNRDARRADKIVKNLVVFFAKYNAELKSFRADRAKPYSEQKYKIQSENCVLYEFFSGDYLVGSLLFNEKYNKVSVKVAKDRYFHLWLQSFKTYSSINENIIEEICAKYTNFTY